MKFKIELIVSGGNELKNDLEKGHVENGIKTDVLPDEEILSFSFKNLDGTEVYDRIEGDETNG